MTIGKTEERATGGKQNSGRNEAQNKTRVQASSFTIQPSRKPPGMEGKCMRCGKPEHQQGQKCAAKNAKCKECHKIGHFYKVCQSKKKTRRANLAQAAPQNEQDTHIDECGLIQPNPPVVNMLKIVNHIGTTSGTQEKHLKFPIDVDVRGPYKHHQVVRVDTGADVNWMNEKTFRRLFPKVKLDVCPYEIQNFGNSTADISILGQFCTYLQFRGKKYLNTFIVTNTNDCSNLLSHGATFRMGVLLPNYPEENVVKGETRYLISKLAHPQVHRMYFRFYRIYGLSSTRGILNPERSDPVQLLDWYSKTAESFDDSRNSQSENRYGHIY